MTVCHMGYGVILDDDSFTGARLHFTHLPVAELCSVFSEVKVMLMVYLPV